MKKFTSMLLVCAMLVSTLICSASAADTGVQKANFAGETTEVAVIEVNPVTNEQSLQVVEVAIPANATAQEEQQIMTNAAKLVTGDLAPQTRAAGSARETTYVTFDSSRHTYVGMAYPSAVTTSSRLYVTYTGIVASGGASTIYTAATTKYNEGDIPTVTSAFSTNYMNVIMVYGGYYGGGTFYPSANNNISVWSRTDQGTVSCNVTVEFS